MKRQTITGRSGRAGWAAVEVNALHVGSIGRHHGRFWDLSCLVERE